MKNNTLKGIVIGIKILVLLNGNLKKNEKNGFQALRLLNKIENMQMDAKHRQNLCKLIKKYFYKKYDDCSIIRKNIIMNRFMYDLIWCTQIDCMITDDNDMSLLKEDIISTFTIILYKSSDFKVS